MVVVGANVDGLEGVHGGAVTTEKDSGDMSHKRLAVADLKQIFA